MRHLPAARCSKSNRNACFAELLRGALGVRMIPSIRSMIAAILLAAAALVGGFGVFAEFRVNHDPARLATATFPLRLVADDATRPAGVADQSFGSRLEVSEAPLADVTPALSFANADRPDATGPSDAVVDPAAGTDAVAQSAAAAPPPETVVTVTPSDQPPQARATTEVAPSETLAAGTPDDQPPPTPAATEAAETVATGMSDDQLPSTQTATEAAGPEIAATGAPDDQAASVQTATTAALPQTAAPANAAAVERQDIARKAAARKRLAAVRRARRTRATAVAQSDGSYNAFSQPGFQSAPQAVGGPFVRPPKAKRGQN
jgi:hypothetical protein